MKQSFKRTLAVTAAAVGLTAVLPISTASAINATECGPRTDLVKVVYEGGNTSICFANGGVVDMQLAGITSLSTGNNDIRFVQHRGGVLGDGSGGTVRTLPRWTTERAAAADLWIITRLRIL
ncbi:beta/gamma crystallin domain-containing protein [Streptomyces avermitilis]|uniref:beta/gamma crystallin domain-containing protein n=1 Tax=Streptomyces avermitilis TaxID=33903 RepID=UPI0036B15AF4